MSGSDMKRLREDSSFGPHLKRPATASGKSTEPVQTAARSQGVTTYDALHYLQAVKDRFENDKDKYDDFLEVMQQFKAQRIDTAVVIARVKELFRGHPRLIIGFNTFLPKGCGITLPLDEETPPPMKKQPVEFDQAINYVNKIKTCFEHDEQVYKAFLEILNMYRKGNKSISEVYHEVASLFQDHIDLLEEFTYFLPDSTGPASVPGHPSSSKPSSVVRRDDNTLMASSRHTLSERIVKREKVGAIHVDRDRGFELPEEREFDRGALKVEKEQRRKLQKQREKKDGREHKEVIKVEKESEVENELDAMQRLTHKRKSARRADELIRKQSQVGEGGDTFVGPSAPAPLIEDKRIAKSTSVQEFPFFEMVKKKLQSCSYQDLLKCLNLYSEDIINHSDLKTLVEDILGKHKDLLEGFNEFLSQRENIGDDSKRYLADVFGRRVVEAGDGAVAVDKDKEREKEQNLDRDRERDRDRDKQRKREIERDKEKDKEREDRDNERERDRVVSHHSKDGPNHKISLLLPKEKYMNKPISEMDLSNCERCTPSYRLLPKNYPKPLSSHRTELGLTVLNDNWVSVTSGSEDYSFKHMRKNQYEESLFFVEDDRFEADMLLEYMAITSKRVGEMVENIIDLIKPESQFSLDEHLSAINLRCIERMYGDYGVEMIDLLRKNPAVVLPVVHVRLKQKHEEWLKWRVDMNKIWAEEYSKIYHKSLDHHFKQQDKKSLSTKGLLTEIKERNEKKRREDDTMLLIPVGNRRPLIPDMIFDYPDPAIHEDLYQIVKYSVYQVCDTMEESDKVMQMWTNFIEPMFGAPTHPHGVEDMEEAAKVKAPDSKQSSSSAGESATTGGADGTDKTASQLADGVEHRNVVSSIVDEFATASSRVKVDRMDTPTSLVDGTVAVTSTAAGNLREDEGDKGQKALKGNLQTDSLKSRGPIGSHSEKADLRKQPSHFERSDSRIKQSFGTDTASSRPSSECMESNEKHGKSAEVGNLGRSLGSQTMFTHKMANDVGHEAKPNDEGLPPGDTGRKSTGRGDKDKRLGYSEETVMFKCNTFNERSGRIEREEGELSPSPEVEEREINGIFSDKSTVGAANYPLGQVLKDCKSNKDSGVRHEDDEEPDADGDARGDHDADTDDEGEESLQKSTEDSENISEAGDEVSGSASGDNDDDSHEDHEEEDEEDEEQEGKVESEGEAEGMADAEDEDAFSMASLDRSLVLCKPLAVHATSFNIGPPSKNSVIFYGNDMFYILFRLYQTLYERILSAKTNSMAAEQKWKTFKDVSTPDLYTKFMTALYNFLGETDVNTSFEDECRSIIGTQSYILFTLDKLIFKLVKQFQAIAADETANKLLLLYTHEKSRGACGIIDIVYHANACVLLHDESVFRFEHKICPGELSIQLMEGGPEKLEVPATAIDYPFQNYLNDYLLSVPERKDRHRVFAERNKRKFTDDEECEAFMKATRNVYVVNGLECKIDCRTSKVSYVLDTEDLLHRRKWPKIVNSLQVNNGPRSISMTCGSRASITKQDRAKWFPVWLEGKLTET